MKTPSITKIISGGFLTTFLAISNFSSAQYFQRWFNHDITRHNYKPEVFYDGLCSRLNYNVGDADQYYNVAVGFTKVSELADTTSNTLYDELRFVRTNKGGKPIPQNYGFAFAKKGSTDWLNSEGHSICEIFNGQGTGGYVAVGTVKNNAETGSSVPGGADALITTITSTGSVTNKFRLDFQNGFDELNCVIRSQLDPTTFYACGTSSFSDYSKVIVVKFTSAGTVSWANVYHFQLF